MTLISRLVFFQEKKTPQKSSEQIEISQVSIIIPVRNNQHGIERYLEHFLDQFSDELLPKEILIVDNNSFPEIKIPDRFSNTKIPIQLIKCRKPGPAAARNFGAKKATGEWLLFNDSDCIPTKSLISGYLEADNGAVAYAGNIKALNDDKLSKYYETQEILIPLKTYDEQGNFVPQYLITANSLVWKNAFDEVRGFNENISIAGGEDVDLGLRLSQIGKLSYAFSSVALHDFSDGFIGFYKRFLRYGKGNRIVEELWKTNLKPKLFRPNTRTSTNEILAKIQYLILTLGYRLASVELRRSGQPQSNFDNSLIKQFPNK